MGGYVVLAFALGFLVTWTYAPIRPRYGAGAATGLKAGLAVWAGFYGLAMMSNHLMGIVGFHLLLIGLAYTLPMMLAAGYVGGMVYREE